MCTTNIMTVSSVRNTKFCTIPPLIERVTVNTRAEATFAAAAEPESFVPQMPNAKKR